MKSDGRNAKKTRKKTGVHDGLEHQLYDWICHQSNKRRIISGEIICAQTQNLQKIHLEASEDFSATILKFLDGQLSNFKRQWGLKSYRSHGEAGDSEQALIDEALSDL